MLEFAAKHPVLFVIILLILAQTAWFIFRRDE